MKMLMKLFVVIAVLCASPHPAHAQEYNRALEMITQINQIEPKQNPGFDSADEILKRRVIDHKNKVIGEVKDITIKDNGSITAMQVNFNRLRLGPEVFVSYRDSNARPSTDGYMLGFSAEQISGLYPTFLSNIESASGGEDDVYSVKKLLGTQVTRQDGRKLGVVNDVLFAANGGRVEALLISIQANNLRGREVAIPINMTSVENNNFGRSVVISDDQADALIDYADDHR